MKHTHVTTFALALALAACGGSGPKAPDSSAPDSSAGHLQGGGQGPDVNPNPPPADCVEEELPPCPEACSAPLGQLAGQPCDTEGYHCGSQLGDGCRCSGGMWQCSPHAPLRPQGCNKVCR